MDQKHALSELLYEMRELLQEIAGSLSASHSCDLSASRSCDRCATPSSLRDTNDKHRRVFSPVSQGEWLDRQGVIDYLRISDRTYYRLKASGTIQPHRFGQRDYYYIPELAGQLQESIRRGRV